MTRWWCEWYSRTGRPKRFTTSGSPKIINLTRQCLDRRIDDLTNLNAELAAWQDATNADQRQVDWQFTTADARIKLRHLYPRQLEATVY